MVSFAINNIIAKRMKPFTDGEYIKECLNEFADQCCPDKKTTNTASLPERYDSSASSGINFNKYSCTTIRKYKLFSFCILALDGSNDICDVEQLAVWIRGVDENFNITE